MPWAPNTRGQQRRQQRLREDRHRHNSTERGYDKAYYRARKQWIYQQLSENPESCWCACCGAKAEVVDHIDPPLHHGQPGSRAYTEKHQDQGNWQLLCKRCNSVKGSRHMTADALRREMGIEQ